MQFYYYNNILVITIKYLKKNIDIYIYIYYYHNNILKQFYLISSRIVYTRAKHDD